VTYCFKEYVGVFPVYLNVNRIGISEFPLDFSLVCAQMNGLADLRMINFSKKFFESIVLRTEYQLI